MIPALVTPIEVLLRLVSPKLREGTVAIPLSFCNSSQHAIEYFKKYRGIELASR